MSVNTIDETIKDRSGRYGLIADEAALAQQLKSTLRSRPGWARLSSLQQHVLEMIMTKIARVVNGDPNYRDNWHDIAGYATLAEQALTAAPSPVLVPAGHREVPFVGPGSFTQNFAKQQQQQQQQAAPETPDTRNIGLFW